MEEILTLRRKGWTDRASFRGYSFPRRQTVFGTLGPTLYFQGNKKSEEKHQAYSKLPTNSPSRLFLLTVVINDEGVKQFGVTDTEYGSCASPMFSGGARSIELHGIGLKS